MAVAIHSYHDANGALPPHALYGKDGKPLLSWRVAILPYVEGEDLFRRFKLDEPWDSPHNLALLPEMPRIYAPFNGKQTPEPHTTYYQVFVGPGAAFEGTEGKRLKGDFPDGTGSTILIVEAGEAVPWTRPEDLPYSPDRPLPPLGGIFPDCFQAAVADGSVRRFEKTISEQSLRAYITRNGKDDPGPE